MRQVLLGMILGALVAGGFAACGIANGDPGNNQNANSSNGNAVCNCKEPTIYYKEITVSCKDGDKAEQLGEREGAFSLVKDIKASDILAALRLGKEFKGLAQRSNTAVYVYEGRVYLPCSLEEQDSFILTLKR
jgi:hypothetical protein